MTSGDWQRRQWMGRGVFGMTRWFYHHGMDDWEPAAELRGLLFTALSARIPPGGPLIDDLVDSVIEGWVVTRETVRRKTDMRPVCRLVVTLPWCPVGADAQAAAVANDGA